MQTVQLYIYVDGVANRVELFQDEKISVTSSVQNFNDIGKLFTDYSQTFTIPASKHNNAIFKHWYESAVGETSTENPLNVDNAFDHRIKYFGFIEIDTIPFRDGKFTMQKANKKNGYIDSYTINFVGNLVQLKDKFKEDKLNQLDGLDDLNFTYNMTNVVIGSYTDLKFPLIGSDRRYEIGTGSSSDITTIAGAIDYRELFPAVRVSKLFEYIANTYGLTFEGEFLNYDQFKQLFLYCKNTEKFNFYSNPISPNFTTKDAGFTQMDLATDTLTFSFQQESNADRYESWLKITPTSSSINYSVQVYNNGILWNNYENLTGYQDLNYFSLYRADESIISGQYITHAFTYKLISDLPMTFNSELNLKKNNGSVFTGYNRKANATADSTSGDLQIRRYLPDMTVDTFLSSIVKAMNLIIVPITENRFYFQPLEAWYQQGNLIDLTPYVEAENIEISKPNLYKQIAFKYEKSENVLNNQYRTLYNLDYGDLIFDNPDSASTANFEVKLPFEDIMWERYTGTNLLTATCWNKDLKAYTPKPVLMYYNGPIYLGTYYYTDGVAPITQTGYHRFSNEIAIGGTDLSYIKSLNWNTEVSTWYLQQVTNGLFQQYYANSIFNIYNQRTRVIKAKAHLGTYLLTSLRLNDRIILSNKRYIINSMTTDLTTGDVDFELLNDFRVINGTTVRRYSNLTALSVDNTAQVVQFLIYKIDYDTFDTVVSGGFLSYPIRTDNDTDIVLNVTIPANISGVDRDDEIALRYYKNGISTEIKIPVYQYA